MLSATAVETGRYIIGGSMPERDPADENRVYNTLTVWDPQGRLITKFRKLHLYDVNIPGGIVFTESEVIGPGSKTAVVKFRESNLAQVGTSLSGQRSAPSHWQSASTSVSPFSFMRCRSSIRRSALICCPPLSTPRRVRKLGTCCRGDGQSTTRSTWGCARQLDCPGKRWVGEIQIGGHCAAC